MVTFRLKMRPWIQRCVWFALQAIPWVSEGSLLDGSWCLPSRSVFLGCECLV
jgi:hypothetical protein